MNFLKKMRRDDFKNINLKIGVSFFAIFSLLMTVSLFTTFFIFQKIIESSENRLSENITNVLSISISRISFSGKYHAQIFSDQLIEKENSIKYIVILGSNGELISSSYNSDFKGLSSGQHLLELKNYTTQIEEMKKSGKMINYIETNEGQLLKEIAMPYYGSFDQGQIGVIITGLSILKTSKEISQSRLFLIALGAFISFIGVILIYVVTNKISYPIRRLAMMFQGVLDYAPMLVMIKDRKGNIVAASNELRTKFLNEADTSSDLSPLLSIDESSSGKKLIDIPTAAEGVLTFVALKFPLYGPSGEDEGLCYIATDVTEHEKIQKALLKSEAEFRSIYESTPIGIVNMAEDYRIIHANRSFQELLGYTESELQNLKMHDITYPEDRDKGAEEIKAIREGRLSHAEIEKRYLRNDGQVASARVSISAVRNEKGEFVHNVALIENITERKKAEEARDKLLIQEQEARIEAQKAVKVRDEFLSIASHELKTPLTALILQTQLLNSLLEKNLLEDLSDEKKKNLIRISEQQLDRFSRLINDLLDVSRIEAGRLSLNKDKINLYDLTFDIIQRFQLELTDYGCTVELVGDNQLYGEWDKLRIEQVLINLLNNAMKFGAGKKIIIKIALEGAKAKLTIQNFGIGISKEDQTRIFERFERAVSSKSFGGLGLGLYIVRQLIEAHGGNIRVESEPGQSATFIVELPLA